MIEVGVVGGGPGGLAAAIACAQRGHSVVLFERSALPPDKACGEGLLPPALRALEVLGARAALTAAQSAPIRSLRYVQEDGAVTEVALPEGGGLGVRRTVLSRALRDRALQAGVVLREHTAVRSQRREPDARVLTLEGGEEVRVQLLVAADGLASPLREAEGLSEPARRAGGRFGVRRHYRIAPWSEGVEIHLTAGVEAYVTPVSPHEVGVALLWRDGDLGTGLSHAKLLERFPALTAKLSAAPASSEARGAGPLERRVRGRLSDRFVLLGDAAGYHDAISGEGLALALSAAVALGENVGEALQAGATEASLRAYDRACARQFRKYRLVSSAMLAVAEKPALRRAVLRMLRSAPGMFERLVRFGIVD